VRCQRKKHPHHHFHVGERSHFVLTAAAAHDLNSKNPALSSQHPCPSFSELLHHLAGEQLANLVDVTAVTLPSGIS
jgi:hypothetical protein